MVVNNIAILLLKKRNDIRILPILLEALEVANASKMEIKNKYKDALVIWKDGTVKKIEKINIKSPYGESWFEKLFNFFNSTWNIEVIFSRKVDLSISEINSMICKHLIFDSYLIEPFFPLSNSYHETIKKIKEADNIEKSFEHLGLDKDINFLDVL